MAFELVDCNYPLDISKGQVLYDNTYFTSKAYYRCNVPFTLIGPPYITCQRNGLWDQPPFCGNKN